ncbi:MAG: hypothetical protein HND44_24105 [Chloroflexi bacterium]|nr:hypothetical protein [Ardenticatenaceae bacterium]NOG37623.1 hypothetical protein [Chloroflexota bacterium]
MSKEIRNISEEEWDEVLMRFKTGLSAGHIYLQAVPHDAEVSQLVNSMEYLLEGLGDIEIYGRTLLYCAHSIEALSSCQRGLNQLSALPPGHEMADLMKGSILAILEEEAIGGLQTALQVKPDYTCAQEALQLAQAMLAQLQEK